MDLSNLTAILKNTAEACEMKMKAPIVIPDSVLFEMLETAKKSINEFKE